MAISLRELDGDAVLVDAAQAGDRDAFAELFRRHYTSVRRSCMRQLRNQRDADEVAQAAFVRAWERLDRCRGERRFGGWVQMIAHNLCIDSLRSRNRVTPMDVVRDTRAPNSEEPESALLRQHDANVVHQALADLPPRQRDVVVARDLEQRRPAEIAAALGLSIGAVDSLLLRGRRRLAAVVANLGDDRGAITASSATSIAAAATGTSPRLAALVGQLQDIVNRVSYHVADVLGVVPGTPGALSRAASAALLGGVLAAGAATTANAPASAPASTVPSVSAPVPVVAAPSVAVAPPPTAAVVPPSAPVAAPSVGSVAPEAPNAPVEVTSAVAPVVARAVDAAAAVVDRLGAVTR